MNDDNLTPDELSEIEAREDRQRFEQAQRAEQVVDALRRATEKLERKGQ